LANEQSKHWGAKERSIILFSCAPSAGTAQQIGIEQKKHCMLAKSVPVMNIVGTQPRTSVESDQHNWWFQYVPIPLDNSPKISNEAKISAVSLDFVTSV